MGLFAFLFGGSDSDHNNDDSERDWFCEHCGAHLNEQGFDMPLGVWQCFECDTVTDTTEDGIVHSCINEREVEQTARAMNDKKTLLDITEYTADQDHPEAMHNHEVCYDNGKSHSKREGYVHQSFFTAAPIKPQKLPEFIKGDSVNHSVFGSGVIKEITPTGSDALLEIDFADNVTKRLMMKSAMRYLKKSSSQPAAEGTLAADSKKVKQFHATTTSHCNKCGLEVKKEDAYCSKCGMKLTMESYDNPSLLLPKEEPRYVWDLIREENEKYHPKHFTHPTYKRGARVVHQEHGFGVIVSQVNYKLIIIFQDDSVRKMNIDDSKDKDLLSLLPANIQEVYDELGKKYTQYNRAKTLSEQPLALQYGPEDLEYGFGLEVHSEAIDFGYEEDISYY